MIITQFPQPANINFIARLCEGNDLILVDLNSTNGDFANGGRVTDRFRLSVDDIVTVGSWMFMFE